MTTKPCLHDFKFDSTKNDVFCVKCQEQLTWVRPSERRVLAARLRAAQSA